MSTNYYIDQMSFNFFVTSLYFFFFFSFCYFHSKTAFQILNFAFFLRYEYLWADGQNVKTPLKVSAGEYIDYLMTWVENQLNNENLFPIQIGIKFIK